MPVGHIKKAFVPWDHQETKALYLCGTTLVLPKGQHSNPAVSGRPGAAYSSRFGARLGGDTMLRSILPCTVRQLSEMGDADDLSSSSHTWNLCDAELPVYFLPVGS